MGFRRYCEQTFRNRTKSVVNIIITSTINQELCNNTNGNTCILDTSMAVVID